MPDPKFKVGDRVRCKCYEHCDATLVILTIIEDYKSKGPIYEVQHHRHVLQDPHFVTEDKIEPIEATA